MSKFYTGLFLLIFCSPIFAEQILYICERPAWDGKEGCGPNNTYYTYNLLVDTADFDKKKPEYIFQKSKGCDASKASKFDYPYRVTEEDITFAFRHGASGVSHGRPMPTIKMDRETLKAVMSGTQNSPDLTCRRSDG